MNWKCFFFGHKWELNNYQNYIDVSYGLRAESFLTVHECTRCKKIKTKSYYAGGEYKGKE